ncbi:SUMF1/EgtB/PvdO family nonheme iron enzyme [Zooshikella marina]|uniref:SUMF1/EgtB/PvdO family nonheme iron enzyme n=1 Tax=Zooshikella ganghwensis TaxID=202772 RepID=UPI001BAEA94F|nr:SUMF1/EgtB/PvdO family nonheme iron enzyme [Zooshikella ganghwensis]MBU2708421.1 SUMF1/EgtB/PvdO family nonheme iron enzyme [Zooshikella ganghwensis]
MKKASTKNLLIDAAVAMKKIFICTLLVLCYNVSAKSLKNNYRAVNLGKENSVLGFEEVLLEKKRETDITERGGNENLKKSDVDPGNLVWVMKHEVQYDLFEEVYLWSKKNGYFFANGCSYSNKTECTPENTQNKMIPVTFVSWIDVILWANALSEKMGLDPVYRNKSGKVIKNVSAGSDKVIEHNAKGFRLPSIQEWIQFAEESMGKNNTSNHNDFNLILNGYKKKWSEEGSYLVIEENIAETEMVGINNDIFEWLGTAFSSDDSMGVKLFNKMYYFCGAELTDSTKDKAVYCDIHTRQFRYNDLGFRLVRKN